jgi:hypothetical protein
MAGEPKPRESTILDSSLDKDPRVAIAAFWCGTVLFFDKLHSRILAKYPRLLVVVDWLLESFYALFASPITALVVSLLLVPFVLSGSIPIIVFCSVTMAWILCVVAVARAKPIKQLSIIPRFVIVVITALLMFGLSRSYVRWSLVNYYAHAQPQVPVTSGNANSDVDQLGKRIDDLLKKEVRTLTPSKVPHTSVQHSVAASMPSSSAATKSANPYELLSDAELIGIAKAVAKEIENVMGTWRYQIEGENEPRRNQQIYEHSPPLAEDERKRLEDEFDKEIEAKNQTYGSQTKVLFIRAEALREILVNHLAQKNSMPLPTDGTIDSVFKRLSETGPSGFNDRDSFKVSAHLLDLVKRLDQSKQ